MNGPKNVLHIVHELSVPYFLCFPPIYFIFGHLWSFRRCFLFVKLGF